MKRTADSVASIEAETPVEGDTSISTDMNRNKRRKNRRRSKNPNPKPNNTDETYGTIEYTNELFFKYYKEQLSTIITTDEEWETFTSSLTQSLPVTFRVCLSSKEVMKSLNDQLQKLAKELDEGVVDEENKLNLKPISWYPESNAWSANINTRKLKKKESPHAKILHQFIVDHNTKGYLTRQEVVSMIPSLLLDVDSTQLVLDMCAAPGSKTTQILEMMHKDAQIKSGNRYSHPSGVLVANDVKSERCNTLITQTKRLRSPSIIVTNHEAQIFPSLYHPAMKKSVTFDRILCDVPCTGDGTMRKNPDIWGRWKPNMGPGLHTLQLQILKRAIKLLRPGGRIVYSTCSHNPIENEAVISYMLNRYSFMKLVDVSNELPGLKRASGLLNWKYMDNDGNWYENHEQLPEKLKARLPPSLFPNGKEQDNNLERCMRLLPHYQDSGAFFVAVLEKINDRDIDMTIDREKAKEHEKKERLVPVPGGTYYFPKSPEFEEEWKKLREFLGADTFPDEQIITISENASKLNFVSKASKFIFDYDVENKLRIKHMGIRILERISNPIDDAKFRICQDGVEIMVNFCPSRIIDVTTKDIIMLLKETDPFFDTFDPKTQESLNAIPYGPIIIRHNAGTESEFVLSGWRGHVSAKVFLKATEKNFYINQLEQA